MVIAGTGHRPERFGGYSAAIYGRLVELASLSLRYLQPEKVISGMALGWDTALADAAKQLRIPYIAAIPCRGHDRLWPRKVREKYHALNSQAEEVVLVSDSPYKPWLMQVRNKWMVDRADLMLAMWDGAGGGTANCINYIKATETPWVNMWQYWEALAKARPL